MNEKLGISASCYQDMLEKGVDPTVTFSVLSRLRAGCYENTGTEVKDLPSPDDPSIIDCSDDISFSISRTDAEIHLEAAGCPGSELDVGRLAEESAGVLRFNRAGLRKLGLLLSPLLSYGVLNGGSATSYIDEKKNRGFNHTLFDFYESRFKELAAPLRGRPKGATPAFVQPDGSPGPGFLELKMRALLLGARNARRLGTIYPIPPLLPMYQMTSSATNSQLGDEY